MRKLNKLVHPNNLAWIPMDDAIAKRLIVIVDKCRIKTTLIKMSIIDELEFCLEESDDSIGLYVREWSYIIDAIDEKLKSKQTAMYDELLAFRENLVKSINKLDKEVK